MSAIITILVCVSVARTYINATRVSQIPSVESAIDRNRNLINEIDVIFDR